ncbi:MAG: hypothetical protein ACJ74E_01880 [Actinomycetes bacterium]
MTVRSPTSSRAGGDPRTPVPPALTLEERATKVRRWLILHRRLVSGVLAFCSVFCALQVLAPDRGSDASTANRGPAPVAEGLLAYPVRLSDAAVAELLAPGDVIDVLGSELRGPTEVVADGLLVTDVPKGDSGIGSSFGSEGDGLVVVAATPDETLALAAAAARGPLTVAVHP